LRFEFKSRAAAFAIAAWPLMPGWCKIAPDDRSPQFYFADASRCFQIGLVSPEKF
jgi:hypothetical protein